MRHVVVFGFVLAGLAAPALAQSPPPASAPELRELVEAMRETAKATREGVDYARVTPDILVQILQKLDKLENKLDKIETLLREPPRSNRR